jgi:membrane carboxypeptidase/penicillin-binding protein
MNEGTGASSRARGFDLPAAGKTGTTDDYSDAWFVGYTPKVVTGVWVGYDRPRPIGSRMSGTRAALPVWTEIMKIATLGDDPLEFEVPDQVVTREVCLDTGLPATSACPNRGPEIFLASQIPSELCYLHSSAFELRPGDWRNRLRDSRDWRTDEEEERHVGDPKKP